MLETAVKSMNNNLNSFSSMLTSKGWAIGLLMILVTLVLSRKSYGQTASDSLSLANDTTQISEMLAKYVSFDTASIASDEPPKEYIGLTIKQSEEGVILRWAPTTRGLWLRANQAGYLIKRYEYPSGADTLTIDEDSFIETWVAGPDNPILPYDSARWASLLPIEDKYAIIAAGATAGNLEVNTEEVGFGVKAKQDNSIFGYTLLSADLSTLAADGMGMRFVDRNVRKGKEYEYRVILNDPAEIAQMDSLIWLDPEGLDSLQISQWIGWLDEQAENFVQFQGLAPQPREIRDLKSVSREKAVDLMWPVEGNQGLSAYLIERSDDGGSTFDSLTKNIYVSPILNLEDTISQTTTSYFYYTDPLDTNYVEYTYKITAIDAFADRSVPYYIKGMGRDLTPPANPVIKSGEYLKKSGEIQLVYEMPEVPDDLTDLYFEYAYHVDSAFVRYESETLDPYDSVYRHAPEPDEYSHYFRMVAEDSAKNKSHSFPIFVNIPDTIPPPVPTEIHAKIDSTGEVEVKWTDEHVDELGFLGYRVYYSNSPTHEFTQLTTKPIIANFYIYHIPLNTLTDKIYYKVQAVDKSYNHSEFSEVAEAIKPDTLKPAPPVFKNIRATEQSIDLFWALSSSHDVVAQRLIRRQGENTRAFSIEDPRLSTFSDTTTQKGVIYEYSLQAIDDNQLESDLSFPIRGKMIDKKRMEMIAGLKGKYDKSAKEISIEWKYQEEQNDYRFIIFRNKDNEKVKSYKSVGPEATSFSESIKQPGSYYYAVKVIHKNGSKSQLSDPVKIKVN